MSAFDAARIIYRNRQAGTKFERIPARCRPRNLEEAYEIQKKLIPMLRGVSGWKVGRYPQSEIFYMAPLEAGTLLASGCHLDAGRYEKRLIEVEVGFVLNETPDASCTDINEIIQNLEFIALIEVLNSKLLCLDQVSLPELLAYSNANEAFIIGDERVSLAEVKEEILEFRIEVDNNKPFSAFANMNECIGLLKPLIKNASWHGFVLKKGQIIATGSVITPLPDARSVQVYSASLGDISVYF